MTVLHILFLFLAFAAAAPTSSRTAPPLANSATFTPKSSSTHLPITHSDTTTHILPVQTNTRPTIPTRPSNPIVPVPVPVHTHARPPPPPPLPTNTSNSDSTDSTQKPISIAFEVLGGLFGSLILISLVRCCINYKKTPNRDRIADILHRHNLQRELAELERNPAVLRRPSLREPAPPYFPRPPSYEDMNPQQPVRSVPPSEYSAVATSSPPPSPPMSQRNLPGPTVTARTPPDLIPQIPSG